MEPSLVAVEPSLVVVEPSLVAVESSPVDVEAVSVSVESALVESVLVESVLVETLLFVTSEPVVGLQRLHCQVPSAEHSHVEQSPSPAFVSPGVHCGASVEVPVESPVEAVSLSPLLGPHAKESDAAKAAAESRREVRFKFMPGV
ncbi:hypothetical protein [Nannocystis pusilla]|uniref:hypothetical protein n=1 Tax=Nannocystis pusilla TaxID=889268 RepID=UPI003B794095